MTAIMLPALFAACTNDDFQTIEQGNQGLDGRKMVDNVTLTVNAAADTRLTWNNGYTFNDGDEIGACLMDEITETYKEEFNGPRNYYLWHEWFTLTDYIHTNYKFTREDGKWTTGAKMAEGNYFFVMPYNANYGYRMAYTFDASFQTQDGTDDAALKEAYAKNNHFVGYGKVVAGNAGGESVAVDMVPVFGTTGFIIENTGTQTYTIEKIVLKGKSIYNAVVLDPTDCTSNLQYAADLAAQAADKNFNVAQYVADPLEDYKNYNADGWYNPNWETYDRIAAMKDVLAEEQAGLKTVEVALTKGNTIAKNQSVNVIAVVFPKRDIKELENLTNPGGNDGEIQLDIYTDKGVIKDIELNHRYTSNDKGGTTTNVLTDLALTSIGTGNRVKVTFDDTSLDEPEEMDVDTDDDLASMIHWQAAKGTAANIVANLKSNVNITKAMYDELKGSKIASVTIKGSSTYNVTVKADVADGALDAFKFDQVKEVAVLGTQSIKKAPASPVTVYPGATLNIAGDLKAKDNNAMAAGILNYGTLNVNADVEASIPSSGFAFTNYATMAVAAGKTLNAGAKVDNGNEVQRIAGNITNAGTITVLQNQEGTVTNTGVIGEEKSASEIARGTNNATIVNNSGKVFLSVNKGDIYANGASTTRVDNNRYGNLIITDLSENDGNIRTGSYIGNIVQEITTDANTDAVDVRANTIWLSASLKVEKKDQDGNFVKVDLTNAGELVKNGPVKIVATNDKARVDGNDQWFVIGAIEVNKDATLRLNKVRATIANETSVSMFGKKDHEAELIINSNATLTVEGKKDAAITVKGDENYNTISNESTGTNISF